MNHSWLSVEKAPDVFVITKYLSIPALNYLKKTFLYLGTVLAQVGSEKQNPNYESSPLSKAEKRVQAAQAKAEKWEKKLKLAEGRLMKDWLELDWDQTQTVTCDLKFGYFSIK